MSAMSVELLNVIGLSNPVSSLVDQAAGGAFEMMAESATEGLNNMFQGMTTWWIGNDTRDLANGQANNIATTMQDIVRPVTIFVAIISVIMTSAKMILSRNAQPAEELFRGLLTVILVSGAGIAAVSILTEISDGFSSYIMSQAGAQDFKFSFGASTGTALMFMFGTVGMIVAGVQWVLMLSRDALLIVFSGLLPLAAAGSTTRTGQQFFSRVTGWLLALIIYKPVAAAIYWVAMRLIRDAEEISAGLSGLTLMMLAIIALPALMRLIVPAVGPAMGKGGGAMAVGTAVATGAVMVASGGGAAAAAPAISGAANVAGAGSSSLPEPQPTNA